MKNNIIKSISLVIIFTILSKLLGMFREFSVAYVFGANNISDAYITGTLISQIVYTGIANALFTAYIPIASRINVKSKRDTDILTNNIINITLLFILFISVILTFKSSYIINLLASSASLEVKEMANVFFRLTIIPSSFLIISYFFIGYLHIQSRFVANIIFSIPMNLCIILGVFLGNIHYEFFAIMYAIALILPALLLYVYSAIKMNYKHRFVFNLRDKYSFDIYMIFRPIFIGSILSHTAEIVDKMFAVSLGEGVVSALSYGKLLEITAVSVIAISVGQVVFPKLSEIADLENAKESMNIYISKILKLLMVIIIPVTIVFILFSETIVRFVLMHGAFDQNALIVTSTALMLYSLSIPAVSISEIIFKAFYSLKKSKIPTIVFSSCMALNILLDYLCIEVFKTGYKGLALTTSFVEWLSMIICMIILIKMIGKLKIQVKEVAKIIFAVVIFSAILYMIKYLFSVSFNEIVVFVVATLLGLLGYLIMIIVLRIDPIIASKMKKVLNSVFSRVFP